jgi:ketosteroid isomerase-like protein
LQARWPCLATTPRRAGDKVAVEVESYGELKNGRVYKQEYHPLITIRDGRISAVREYLDTQHVFATWFA